MKTKKDAQESVGPWQSSREIAELSQIYDLLTANSSAIEQKQGEDVANIRFFVADLPKPDRLLASFY